MAIIAMCMPILAGKKEKWQAMMDQVTNDPNFALFVSWDSGVAGRPGPSSNLIRKLKSPKKTKTMDHEQGSL